MYSPIALFSFKRPHHTFLSIDALSKNKESIDSDLFVFIDGAKCPSQLHLLDYVEKVALSFKNSFKSLNIIRSDINLGGARSQRSGVTSILQDHESVIVIEDDILVSPYFLSYINQGLSTYKNNEKVWHINGFCYPIKYDLKECFFSRLMFCWGWATWKDRWFRYINDSLYHDPYYLKDIYNNKMRNEFNLSSKVNFYWSQIESNLNGGITWDIFWYSYIFLNKGLCLTPSISLTRNIGHDGSGVHCLEDKIMNNLEIKMQTIKDFPENISEDQFALKKLTKYFERRNNFFFKALKALRTSNSIYDLIRKICIYFSFKILKNN